MRYVCLSAALLLTIAAELSGGVIYSYYEGEGVADTLSIDDRPTTAALWWANQFVTQPGGEAISSITVAFGPHVPNGTPVTFIVYGDPNSNGLPDDITWLGEVNGTVGPFSPPAFGVNSLLTLNFPTPINVGSSFFIAALIKNAGTVPCVTGDPPGTCYLDIRAEQTNPQHRSWFAANETDPTTFDSHNPNGVSFPPTNIDDLTGPAFNLDFIVTANGVAGTASTVPEPATAIPALLGLAAVCFAARRKRT